MKRSASEPDLLLLCQACSGTVNRTLDNQNTLESHNTMIHFKIIYVMFKLYKPRSYRKNGKIVQTHETEHM